MSFTITRKIERLPSYSLLCKLAEENRVQVTGNEHAGSFSVRGVRGDYEICKDCVHGKLAGHGVTGEFSFVIDQATITVGDKPFWLPETLLRQKITEGLDTFCNELTLRQST